MWKSGKYVAIALVGAGLAAAADAPASARGHFGYGGAGYHRYGPRAEAEFTESFISRARHGRLGEIIGAQCLESWVDQPQWTWKCAGYGLAGLKKSINYNYGIPIDEPRFTRAFIRYHLGLGPDPLGALAARHRPHYGYHGRRGGSYGRM